MRLTFRPTPFVLKLGAGVFGLLLVLVGVTSVGFVQSPQHAAITATTVQSYLTDDDWIRVGIAKTGLDNFDYDSIQLLGTGGLLLSAQPNSLPSVGSPIASALSLGAVPANTVVTIRRVDTRFFEVLQAGKAPQVLEASVLRVAPVSRGLIALPEVKRRSVSPQYRGFFDVVASPEKPDKLTAVNVLLMKDYLSAVVPNELPLSFGVEAVKAQAVLARNYAINPREKPWQHFDICDTQYCQAYYGANTENLAVTKLLAQTHGTVALYEGRPILALYSSTHGGVSENYENVFLPETQSQSVLQKYPYLVGRSDYPIDKDLSVEDNARWYYQQKPQSYDVNSPLYRWTKSWPAGEFGDSLLKNLVTITEGKLSSSSIKRVLDKNAKYPLSVATQSNGLALTSPRVGQFMAVRALKRGVSGKILVLEIETTEGVWQVNKEYTIRKLFAQNGSPLPSANFVITAPTTNSRTASGGTYTLHGGGFGHGVGMSQYGAGWMAQHGKTFEDIIRHYYYAVRLGSIPLALFPKSGKTAVRLDFVPPRTTARLRFNNPGRQAVTLLLNGAPVEQANGSMVSLKAGDNRLELFQAAAQPNALTAPVTAWLEF